MFNLIQDDKLSTRLDCSEAQPSVKKPVSESTETAVKLKAGILPEAHKKGKKMFFFFQI